MNYLGRYLNKHCFNSGTFSFMKKVININHLHNYKNSISKFALRTYAGNKSTSANQDSDKSNKYQEEKKTKHIYKKKEQNLARDENSDIIRKESHFFREGFSNGIHIREEVSYVCYELPSEGRTAESKGKVEDFNKMEKTEK